MAQYDPKGRFEMVTFEPNDSFCGFYAEFPRHSLIRSAVHDRDGVQKFYLDREDGDGSTLFRNKLTREDGGYGTLDKAHPVIVDTVDLSKWLADNTRPSDYVILKLDVEGAEYDILEKMLRDGTLDRLAYLFVEWHWNKVGIPWERHGTVVRALRRRHVPVMEWDAAGY